MSNNIFPDLARGASTGIIQGLELARIRNERRDQNRRIRLQEETLSTLQNNLNAAQFDADGNQRSETDLQLEQLNLLTSAAVDPQLDLETRNQIGQQARQLSANRTTLTGRNTTTSTGGSALNFGFGGSTPAATNPNNPVDLNLTAPALQAVPLTETELPAEATPVSRRQALLQASQNQSAVNTTQTTAPAIAVTQDVPTQTATPNRNFRNANGGVALDQVGAAIVDAFRPENTGDIVGRNGEVIVSGVPNFFGGGNQPTTTARNSTTDTRTRRVTAPNGRQALVSSSIEDTEVLNGIVAAAEQLVGPNGEGVLGASSVQELITLLENRLIQLGQDPSSITSQQFEQLANSGQLFTIPQT